MTLEELILLTDKFLLNEIIILNTFRINFFALSRIDHGYFIISEINFQLFSLFFSTEYWYEWSAIHVRWFGTRG